MKTRSIAFALAFAVAFSVSLGSVKAQDAPNPKSTEILEKAHQVNLLNQLVPMNLTKPQYDTILLSIEKIRPVVKETIDNEAKVLLTLEPDLDSIIQKAIDDHQVPNLQTMIKVKSQMDHLALIRRGVSDANVGVVYNAVMSCLDDGQKKEISNSLDTKGIDPSMDPTKMSQEDRIRAFVRVVLLDPDAYPLLVKLSAHPAEKSGTGASGGAKD